MRENGSVMLWEEAYPVGVRVAMGINVKGKRGGGGPKKRLIEGTENTMEIDVVSNRKGSEPYD